MRCDKFKRWLPGPLSSRLLFSLGKFIARKPWTVIVSCLAFTAFSGLGFFWFRRELDPLRLWVPQQSRFASDTTWLQNRFGVAIRPQYALIKARNVLDPDVLSQLAHLHAAVENAIAPHPDGDLTYEDVCFRIPAVSVKRRRRRRRRRRDDDFPNFADDDFFNENTTSEPPKYLDPVVAFDASLYCSILENFPRLCFKRSILELWNFNATTVGESSLEAVLDTLNASIAGPVYGHPLGYANTLGGVKYDEKGKIISAETALLAWFVTVNITGFDTSKHGNDVGTEVWGDDAALSWESAFLEVAKNASANARGFELHYEAGRSFGDVSNDSMFQDMDKLMIGIIMMFVYIQLIISKFNWVEIKLTLGSVGLMCIGLALVASCGACSVLGIPYGPIHGSLPFMLMGLGIDDMFIMKACWEQANDRERTLPTPDRVGLMLERAGTSIIVTSFTDIIAFLVGSITILPSLQSFCIYAAAGVFFIFVFVITFYVAVFVLDLRRIEQKRNGLLPCIKHPDFEPPVREEKSTFQYILHKFYSEIAFTTPMKILIIATTVVMTGFSVEAIFHLRQKFDPAWFIPESSYFSEYIKLRRQYYPEMGYEATVFLGRLNYGRELPKIRDMIERLRNETDLVHDFDSWIAPFDEFVSKNFDGDAARTTLSDAEWSDRLSKFLFSRTGAKYRKNFRFDGELECGKRAPPVTASSVDFVLKIFDDPAEYLPAMHRLQDVVLGTNFTSGDRFATLWARVFATWITDEIIQVEVERNLELALACVMICTLIMIGDWKMCFWIFVCVTLTIVNTCGWMEKMGLTIDVVTCICLELGIGFCVDYAAHIGHKFLTVDGTRRERALETVTSIGAAVLYGGGSTVLALSTLSLSGAYVFKTFFKIFFLVITFGIFNGLLFLPVALSLIGPRSHVKNAAPLERDRDKDGAEPTETIALKDIR